MTILQRAATIAVMTFSLAGLISNSTPSRATEIDRMAITTPLVAPLNAPSPQIVPQAPVDAIAPVAAASADTPSADTYDSLDAAVAAQTMADADDAMRCLAGAIYFEAKGEPLSGQLAVAQVIINRAKSGRFATDVCGVVKQRGQFGFVRGGEIPTIDAGRTAYKIAIAVAKVALAKMWDSPAPTALFFNTPNRVPAARLTRIAAIGNHVFYR